MVFTPQTWHDLPATDTPIIAARLSRIEAGIAAADAAAAAAQATADAATGPGGTLDPAYQRQVNAAYLTILFDTVTGTWPARSTVTASLTQVVEWVGNAQPPEGPYGVVPGVDRWYGPLAGSSIVPGDTVPPDVFPDPVTGISLSTPSISAAGSTVTVSATLTTTASTTFAFAQIAVRGPAGQKIDCAFHPGVTVNGTLNLSGGITATQSGTWTAFVTYNITGGAAASDWVDGPSVSVTVTVPTAPPPATSGGVPLIGNSGLAWNSGTFQGPRTVAGQTSFGTWRGRPLDAMLTFTGRGDWAGMFTIESDWAAFNGVTVISNPPQPNGQNCSATAAGSNDARWRDYGSALTAAGLNRDRFILRVWEVNGTWYDWALGHGNSEATFIAAMKRMSTSVKSTAPNIKISLNWNRGYSGWGGDWRTVSEALVGSGPSGRYVDIIGIDSYDWYPGQTNLTKWNDAQSRDPNLLNVATWCRAHDVQMSVEEWALINATGGAEGDGGGDDPYYIGKMWDFFEDNADILAYEGYYNHTGLPADLQHVISTGMYPNAADAYRSPTRWGT